MKWQRNGVPSVKNSILALEDGRITESGTHAELVKLGGSYSSMNEIQTSAATGIV